MLYCLLVLQFYSYVGNAPNGLRAHAADSLKTTISTESPSQPLVFLSAEHVVAVGPVVDAELRDAEVNATHIGAASSPLRSLSEILEEMIGTISPEAGRSTGIPIFRGSSPKRIVVLFDGVPLGHSAQREGPSLMALGMLDPSAVGSVSLGSGGHGAWLPSVQAGGALRIGSRLDEWAESPTGASSGVPELSVSQQFSSADRGWSARLSAAGQSGRLRYVVGGLGRILGDLRSGKEGGDFIQPYTGHRESTLHALAAYQLASEAELRVGLLTGWRDRQAVVSDLESLRLSAPPPTLDVFSPRQMTLGYVSATVERPGLLRKAVGTVWLNRQRETATFRRPAWGKTLFDDDRITVMGTRGRADLAVASAHVLGLEIEIKSEGIDARRKEVRDEAVVFHQRGRFPGGTRAWSAAGLVENRWTVSPNTTVSGGLRVSSDHLQTHYGPSVFETSGLVGKIDRSFVGLSWYARGTRTLGQQGGEIAASVSRTFAAPGLDDVASNAYWFGGRDVPNPDVGPERALQFELSYKTERPDGARLEASLYRTDFKNRIGRAWFGPGPDFVRGTNDDSFRFANTRSSDITGFEIDASQPTGSIGDATVVFAGNVMAQHVSAPADVARFVPPVVYRWGVTFEVSRFLVEPYLRGAAQTPASELAPGGLQIEATPGWTTLNVRTAIAVGQNTGLNVAIENMGDSRYREHGSYLEAAGRNLVVALSYSL